METVQREPLIGGDCEMTSDVVGSLHPVITPLTHTHTQTDKQTEPLMVPANISSLISSLPL